jgi:hypothetical protein
VQELIPIGLGLVLGAVLGSVRPSMRLPLGVLLTVAFGVLATTITGEFKSSWGYLLIDIPLVALSALAGLLAGRRVARLRLQ